VRGAGPFGQPEQGGQRESQTFFVCLVSTSLSVPCLSRLIVSASRASARKAHTETVRQDERQSRSVTELVYVSGRASARWCGGAMA
jgi:hypothetical protein